MREIVERDLMAELGQKLDEQFFGGNGTPPNMLGLLNDPNVTDTAIGARSRSITLRRRSSASRPTARPRRRSSSGRLCGVPSDASRTAMRGTSSIPIRAGKRAGSCSA